MIPRRLLAPEPGWTVDTDVVVIGSGIAGLITALAVAAHQGPTTPGEPGSEDGFLSGGGSAVSRWADGGSAGGDPVDGHSIGGDRRGRRGVGRVLLVTKALLDAGSTRWAQGGIAAALAPGDSPAEHLADTLEAGVGLCDVEAVRTLVTEGPDAVRRLIGLGTDFDRDDDGRLSLTREGGHHRRRIAHAGGDATGAEISRALLAARKEAGIEVIEHALVLDLLVDENGRAAGVTLHVMGEGQRDGVGAVRARAVVLATGGLGQVFSATTNPEVSTGDGVALALRAGAEVTDLEFVQFHPTVLYLGEGARGQQPLITEAVRGEGAHLIDASGERFMLGRHELAELAPRDVVAKGIMSRMRETGAPHMYLDGRHLGAETWERRFPTILAKCRDHGIDPVTEPIPVVPAAHYASGGVRTDTWGRTSVPGLYACGEVACTGVHGANRLASNSLLEGLVFGERIATAITNELTTTPPPTTRPDTPLSPGAEVGTLHGQPIGVPHTLPTRPSRVSEADTEDVAANVAQTPPPTVRPDTPLSQDTETGTFHGQSIGASHTLPTRPSRVSEADTEDVAANVAQTPPPRSRVSAAGHQAGDTQGATPYPQTGAGVRTPDTIDCTLSEGTPPEIHRDPSEKTPVERLASRTGFDGDTGAGLLDAQVREDVQRVMTAYVGVLRNADGLEVAARELERLGEKISAEPCVESWEATNLHTVATAIVAAARARQETRGSHWREDHPDRDDKTWLGHLVTRAAGDRLTTVYEPLPERRGEAEEGLS